MVARIRYNPNYPAPINLLEASQGTSPPWRWLSPFMAFRPVVCLIICACWGIIILGIHGSAKFENVEWGSFASILTLWPFWWSCLCLTACTVTAIQAIRCNVQEIPQVWKQKAKSVMGSVEPGSVILVLNCGVGASAIPFAREAVLTGKAKQVQFVCIDHFYPLSSYPYRPEELLYNLVDAGLFPESVTAHKLSKDNSRSGSPTVQYTKLPFASGSVSLIICDRVLIKGILKGRFDCECLQELARVLRPGGRLILQDPRLSKSMARIMKRISSQAIWKSIMVERAASKHWIDLVKSDKPNYMSTEIGEINDIA